MGFATWVLTSGFGHGDDLVSFRLDLLPVEAGRPKQLRLVPVEGGFEIVDQRHPAGADISRPGHPFLKLAGAVDHGGIAVGQLQRQSGAAKVHVLRDAVEVVDKGVAVGCVAVGPCYHGHCDSLLAPGDRQGHQYQTHRN
jgi:hypothetical protein